MTVSETAVETGSGNVFADLGLPGADAHLVKADLVVRIDAIVRERGLTQAAAGCASPTPVPSSGRSASLGTGGRIEASS